MTQQEKQEILDVFSQLGLTNDHQRLRFRFSSLRQSEPSLQTFILVDSMTAQATTPEAEDAKLD